MKLTGENRRTRRKTCPSATSSTTNPTWTDSYISLRTHEDNNGHALGPLLVEAHSRHHLAPQVARKETTAADNGVL
jgi:hypothetical protein